jgi:SSS family solute:Na+ symporter
MLGIAVTGLLAAFMAGVAANVTAFNMVVVTCDLIQAYFVKDRDAAYYLRAGRLVTIGGILISVLTAFIAKGYSNIMNYIQTLFSIFNAPLFATFIIAMFWKRATAWGGFFSLVAGTAAAYIVNRLNAYSTIFHFGSPLSASFWQAIIAFLVDAAVMVTVSLVTKPKPAEELPGLVWGMTREVDPDAKIDDRDKLWWRSPILLGGIAMVLVIILNIIFAEWPPTTQEP